MAAPCRVSHTPRRAHTVRVAHQPGRVVKRPDPMGRHLSRRRFLQAGAALGAAAAVSPMRTSWALGAAAPTKVRQPGSLPNPGRPEGTDLLPQIEHIVVLDDGEPLLRQLLRHARTRRRLHLERQPQPTNRTPTRPAPASPRSTWPTPASPTTTPASSGTTATSPCDERAQRRVRAQRSGPTAMGYWDGRATSPSTTAWRRPSRSATGGSAPCFGADLPEPPLPDGRHRRRGTSAPSTESDAARRSPPNGTIFDSLNRTASRGATTTSTSRQPRPVPVGAGRQPGQARRTSSQFVPDAAAGKLPSFTFVEPDFEHEQSEEDPQDIPLGESFAAQMVQRRDAQARLGEDAAHLDLRRARGLLRPRAAAAGGGARRHPARHLLPPTSPAATTATGSGCRR